MFFSFTLGFWIFLFVSYYFNILLDLLLHSFSLHLFSCIYFFSWGNIVKVCRQGILAWGLRNRKWETTEQKLLGITNYKGRIWKKKYRMWGVTSFYRLLGWNSVKKWQVCRKLEGNTDNCLGSRTCYQQYLGDLKDWLLPVKQGILSASFQIKLNAI